MDSPGYVAVVGAANIDVIGRSAAPIIGEDSNPGGIAVCAGGVGRNISENLARLGVEVKLISALGDDVFGRRIIELSEDVGIDMSHCHIRKNAVSSTYMAILDNDGEMKLALSDMSILDALPEEHLEAKSRIIEGAALVVLDAGLTESTMKYILSRFSEKRIFLDPVSVGKAKHAKSLIGGFDTIKMNRLEAEFLSGSAIFDDDSLESAGEYFIKKGVKRVFISSGSKGVYYKTPREGGVCMSPHITPVNVTGAGDAFMAGVVYCTLHGFDNSHTAKFAGAMARVAIMSESTVSPLMSVSAVEAETERTEALYEKP